MNNPAFDVPMHLYPDFLDDYEIKFVMMGPRGDIYEKGFSTERLIGFAYTMNGERLKFYKTEGVALHLDPGETILSQL